MSPVETLVIAIVVVAVGVPLLRPRTGLLWRAWRAWRPSERVLVEDALKHFYDCEYRRNAGTLQSLCGALEIHLKRGAELMVLLEQRELIRLGEHGYELTPEGRREALRVVRTHRLWELYLADETGLDASEWHTRAEEQEHKLTAPETEDLARHLGYPRYDPHGDPIPTADGDVGPLRGSPLNHLAAGTHAEIVHLEDEPDSVYARIVAQRLHLGMFIRILHSRPDSVRFESDKGQHVLAPVVAANVWARAIPDAAALPVPASKLSSLNIGQQARVLGISRQCRGAERRRMLDLGIVPGTLVQCELRSPGGDPTAFRIRGSLLALRREQADLIEIEPGVTGNRGADGAQGATA